MAKLAPLKLHHGKKLPILSRADAQPSPALLEANLVLQVDPERAEVLLRVILQSDPADPTARLLLATALRMRSRPDEAYSILIALVEQFPDRAAVVYQLGLTLCQQGNAHEGLPFLLSARRLVPEMPGMGRALGDAYTALADFAAADLAYSEYLATQPYQPAILEAQQAMRARKWRDAEAILRSHLSAQAEDPMALLMLADIALAVSRTVPALQFLERVLVRVPSWLPARCARARIHSGIGNYQEALAELDAVLAIDSGHVSALGIKATTLSLMGDFDAALACREHQRELRPEDPRIAMFHGNVLRTLGRHELAVAAYRKSTQLCATFGEGYWSLANLKRYRFEADEIVHIDRMLGNSELSEIDRVHLLLARAKAHEDAGEFESAFRSYADSNRLWRGAMPAEAGRFAAYTARCRKLLTPDFFAARVGVGAISPDPIFVVGMPRSGSTLVEQILASHTSIEGTMELMEIMAIADRLGGDGAGNLGERYPSVLATLDPREWRTLGDEYLTRTQGYRRLGRPQFVDKTPNNFLHTGLIHLILPNARIIDVRRHPLACGWSVFKQHFAQGQAFSYDLAELGAFYREYVALMAHFDAVLPGRVHRVFYEQLVADPEAEIRRLLEHCGLPFQSDCLHFHETVRAVATPSGQQVRQPISASGLADWQPYERWLGPLKATLGDVLTSYPAAPGR